MIRAVLFDVDFTLAKPGPDLGPEGYRILGARFGLDLDPSRYDEARMSAIETLERHPELEHDEEVWVAFTERIVRGMGGEADEARACALEMTRAWAHAVRNQSSRAAGSARSRARRRAAGPPVGCRATGSRRGRRGRRR